MKPYTMRTIGFRSNILFAITAAVGLIAALGQPWYGASPTAKKAQAVGELPTQMEDFLNGIGRAFTAHGGTSGWDALERADTLIAGLAVATVLLLLLTLVPALQVHVGALARWTSIAAFAVIAVKLIDEPGSNLFAEPRYGLMVALLAGAVLVASTLTVASAPARRKTEPKAYTPPPPPAHAPESSWGPPQF